MPGRRWWIHEVLHCFLPDLCFDVRTVLLVSVLGKINSRDYSRQKYQDSHYCLLEIHLTVPSRATA